jgi:hypothetical protein
MPKTDDIPRDGDSVRTNTEAAVMSIKIGFAPYLFSWYRKVIRNGWELTIMFVKVEVSHE